ncbi:alpha-amylase family glycosyl hydrolase [Robiginitalea sp. SC105]|uniref:alpha-amylase family glycosyl hydrolase n=1 Tax=Robiginitalea sp. SC105 TaxID=2762332 RepID=UPI00163B1911|nr:alpha-amylase family glycosyl hydrolase [Robiginitalea sp. SC105]MBC2838040.1 alpha-glucosidase C-terminal domain-containing protein [Robiginitalea sp. SC105]
MNQLAIHQLLAGTYLESPAKKDLKPLFDKRLAANLGLIQELFFALYPGREDSFGDLLSILGALFRKRPEELRFQDLERLREGAWYQSEKWVGMQLYADRFNGDIPGLEEKIPYFEKLGINFLHIMPLTRRPAGENDGGYAVSSYTEIDPVFGTEADFKRLTSRFREKGICLMLDFVVNHTSDEFPWAQKARAGEPGYADYYYTYPDRTIPDLFEESLPEVFPETSPGNFTWIPEMDRWVMTVFNDYQWDLNYSNPKVFLAMLENMVALANKGVDVLRFDALAFLWKKIGTDSQNLPEAHMLISLFRLCLQVIAPGVAILAEAIVAPHEIVRYFGEGRFKGNECEIAYNATFMACLWNSVATKKTNLLNKSLRSIPPIPPGCSWVNYIRCHDDIGLGFDDRHIEELGWDPGAHRRFLIDYYCQRLDWSPARGAVFMFNPLTGDGRITGSTASLLGLEAALESGDAEAAEGVLDKIVMMYGIILASAGIPLIYAGDEIGMLNDYSYLRDKNKENDSRWINRPFHDWESVAALDDKGKLTSRIFDHISHLIRLRRANPALGGRGATVLHQSGNEHLFVFERRAGIRSILVIANFDENPQVLNASWASGAGYLEGGKYRNLIDGKESAVQSGLLEIPPYGLFWLEHKGGAPA